MKQDFYVGYAAAVPPRIVRWLKPFVTFLFAAGAALGLILVAVQQQFDESRFEFNRYRTYTGRIHLDPYPRLQTSQGDYLLVAPGKHGAEPLVGGFVTRPVRLWGALIEHGPDRMLELDTRAIEIVNNVQPLPQVVEEQFGTAEFVGEIVDSKCYLGVMNPGRGKVHRDCAARCISGGIPPALLVRDATGHARMFLLRNAEGGSPGRQLLPLVGEPVRVRGSIARRGGQWILRADPATFQRE